MKKYVVFGWLLFISISLFPNYKTPKHVVTHNIVLLQTTNDNNTGTNNNNTGTNNTDTNNNGINDTDNNNNGINNSINNGINNEINDNDINTGNLDDTNDDNDDDFTTNMLYGAGGALVGGFIMYFVGASAIRRKP